jgi:glycosyltransferase involved in cell wall biosynthesis
MPVSLSLAMIVKNEDQVLDRVLLQARTFCDELVIVDTGSTDRTVDLAQSLGATVHHFDWIDDFAAARNAAFAHCTGDWILWLDADDVVPPASQQALRQLKESGLSDDWDAVVCNYQIAFAPDGNCLVSMPRERLIRRACGGQWEFPIHEGHVLPEGAQVLERLDIAIEHRKPAVYVERSSRRNVEMLAKLVAQGDESPRTWYYYGKELKHHEQWDDAVAAFARHVALNPYPNAAKYQALHMGMVCLMALDCYDEALDWGMRAVQLDSSRAEALTELGVIYYRRQEFARAVPLLTAATVCRRPNHGSVQEEDYTWRPYHYLSLCYEGLGECDKAIEAALKALPTIPDKQVILGNIRCFADKLA